MNLKDFEKSIDSVILYRWQDIFNSKNLIADIEKKDDYFYKTIVYWTDDYDVKVYLDNDFSIKNSSCNCPYDKWPICKHQVAVFYKLRKLLNIELKSEKKNKKVVIIDKKDNNKAYFKWIIIDSIRSASRWHWYVTWDRTDYSLEWAEEVIFMIDDFLKDKNYKLATIALSIVIETLIIALQKVDDSNWSYWDIISWTCIWEYLPNLITEIKVNWNKKDKDFLLDEFLNLVLNKKIHWFDFEKEIIEQIISIIDNKSEAEKIYQIMDKLDQDNEFWNYKIEKYRIISKFFIEKLDEFVSKNKYEFNLQMYIVDELINSKKFFEAQKILLSLQKYDKNNNRTHISISDKLYIIAIEIKDKNLIKKYSFEIFVQRPTKYHYLNYKKSKDIKEDILKEFDNHEIVINSYEYPDICLEEKDEKRFVDYFLRNTYIRNIDRFFTKLIKLIPDKVYDIYKKEVLENLVVTRDRSFYKDQCKKIRKMFKIKQEETTNFVTNLISKYKQRRALIEELNILLNE